MAKVYLTQAFNERLEKQCLALRRLAGSSLDCCEPADVVEATVCDFLDLSDHEQLRRLGIEPKPTPESTKATAAPA